MCLNQVIGRVLEIEELVQTDATRKRMKHLAHLPISGMHSRANAQVSLLLLSSLSKR